MSAMVAQAAREFSTRTYDLKDFTILDVSNVVKVIYSQGDTYSVKLTGRTDWLDYMEVKSSEGRLTVKAKNPKKFKNIKEKDQPDGKHNFILELTAPCLQNILISGVSTFEAKRLSPDFLHVRLEGVSKLLVDDIEVPNFSLGINGVSEVRSKHIQCKEMNVDISGASKMELNKATVAQSTFTISGASKVKLNELLKNEKCTFNVNGASDLKLNAETSGLLQAGFSGASKGELTYKGGNLRTWCTGASKLEANVNCATINAHCDGASKTRFSGTADKVEIDRGGVAANIDTSRLNQF